MLELIESETVASLIEILTEFREEIGTEYLVNDLLVELATLRDVHEPEKGS
jgi:hypothetical protein